MCRIDLRLIFLGVAIATLTGCTEGNNTTGSTVAGAALGGTAAGLLVHGSAQIPAIIGAAVIGGIVGNATGKALDKQEQSTYQAYPVYPYGRTIIVTSEPYNQPSHCRTLVNTFWDHGRKFYTTTIVCQYPDGVWRYMN